MCIIKLYNLLLSLFPFKLLRLEKNLRDINKRKKYVAKLFAVIKFCYTDLLKSREKFFIF